jgi:N-acyl-D-aspartate/D-glutamate deacylase
MRRLLFAPLALLAAAFATRSSTSATSFDLIVRGGTILDGSGSPRFRADVGVTGGFVSAVGDLSGATAPADIDARGLMVTPGFINLHSHAERAGLQVADNMLSQGVTTEILNADGSSPLDIAAQLRAIDSSGTALNVGANIGFNSVWQSVMGETDRRASADEIARMQRLVSDNLARGAYGVSSGLDYKPGYYATEDEVVQVVSPARAWRTNFPNHDRVRPETRFSARAAVQETMRIGERAGINPVITHMKVSGRERSQADVVLGEMAALSRRGVYTSADVYPYLSGMTGLGALIIPGWAQEGGIAAARQRFADPALRRRIIDESDETIAARFTGPAGILVLSTGRYLDSYMQEFGTTSPGEAIVRILEKESPRAILGFGDEADLVKILQFPDAAVSCDCGATVGPTGHPRNYGTFPRVLGRYVREQRIMSWEEAIRKMTGLPATIAGMVDRGVVAVGMRADLTVFDTATVIDRATFEEPGLRSLGIRHVVVNGRIALRDGASTGVRAGQTLRRGSWMPSRPQNAVSTVRRFAAEGSIVPLPEGSGTTRVAASLVQGSGGRAATGSFVVTDAASGATWRASALGVVQEMPGWASVTGRLQRDASTEERAFSATLEAADPHVPDTPRTLTLDIEGRPLVRGILR